MLLKKRWKEDNVDIGELSSCEGNFGRLRSRVQQIRSLSSQRISLLTSLASTEDKVWVTEYYIKKSLGERKQENTIKTVYDLDSWFKVTAQLVLKSLLCQYDRQNSINFIRYEFNRSLVMPTK